MKKFNDTGTCIPEKHYMVNVSKKLDKIIKKIEQEEYFVINRPRQYGKTTTLFMLEKALEKRKEYFSVRLSFEGIDSESYEKQEAFIAAFIREIKKTFRIKKNEDIIAFIDYNSDIKTLGELGDFLTYLIIKIDKKTVLMIDEVDKSSNNQLFLDFLGMLRSKYLSRNEGRDITFQSVILAGVHDIKTLRLKIRPDDEHKFNSPWNIASDFDVDMSFSTEEIRTMLLEYKDTNNVSLDEEYFSERLYFYTSGYPFLVSKLCKIIDEKIMSEDTNAWENNYIDNAVKILIKTSNTNFDSLIKNIENTNELKELVKKIILDGIIVTYNKDNPVILLGITYGIFKNENNQLKLHNRIYEQRIYEYMSSLIEVSSNIGSYSDSKTYIKEDGKLDVEKILIKFKDFMKHEYSENRKEFLESNGRLLFLAFLSPIINGKGFAFKEVQGGDEKRFDIVITYAEEMHVIEMKIWHGEEYNKKGQEQLSQYLEQYNLDKGCLLTFDFRKHRKQEVPLYRNIYGKRIFEVVV